MRLLSVLAVLASNVALAQIYIGPGGVGVGVPAPAPVPVVVGQANYPVSYQPHPQGFTQVQVVAPAGVQIVVYDGYAMVGNGYGTVVAGAYPGRFYRVDFVNPDGTRWEQTVAAQAGMIASLGVVPQAPPPPPPPQPVYAPPPVAPPPPAQMAPGDFASLQNAINQAAFPRDKIAVLATAAASAYFSCGQVGRLIDLYAFPEDKVRVARLVRDHIVDPGNEYTLYAHYAFPDDREKVRHILMRQ